MAFSIEQLRAAADAELIERHDRIAGNTSVGVSYYLEELHRREQLRAMESSRRLARAAVWLTGANALVALAAVLIAVLV